MAGVSATGLGSGIDINGLVSGLIQAESQPVINRLARKEANLQAELSAVGILKSSLSQFQSKLSSLKDAETFSNRSASSSDSAIASFSADKDTAVGSYSLEITSLATAQKLVTQQDYVVSEGTLEFADADGSFTITLDSSNNATIEDVRDAINNAEDNIGVTATILNINGSSRLVFTTDETGADNSLTITGTTTSGDLDIYDYNSGTATPDGSGDVAGYYDQVTAATDAVFMVDGQAMTSATNTVEDVIPGATITLKEANAGEPITLSISQNNNAIKGQIKSFVDGYNELIGLINEQTSYNPETKVAGSMLGDSLVRSIQNQIRSALTNPTGNSSSNYTSLASIGITTERDGTLKLESSELDDALKNDYAGVTALFSDADHGIAGKVDTILENYLKSDGTFDGRTDSINEKLSGITDDREKLNLKLQKMETRLFAQYNAMDSLVNSLNATGNWLTSALDNLPGVVRKTD